MRCFKDERTRRSSDRERNAIGAYQQCQPGRQDLERGFIGRIAHKDIGDSQADMIKSAGNRNAEALIAFAAAILKRCSHTGLDDPERGAHDPSRHAEVQPCAASLSISPASPRPPV